MDTDECNLCFIRGFFYPSLAGRQSIFKNPRDFARNSARFFARIAIRQLETMADGPNSRSGAPMSEITTHSSTAECSATKAAARINHGPPEINLALTSIAGPRADITSVLETSCQKPFHNTAFPPLPNRASKKY
jgi:hypothetical protein